MWILRVEMCLPPALWGCSWGIEVPGEGLSPTPQRVTPSSQDHGFAGPGTGDIFHGPACQEGGVRMTAVTAEGP